MSLSTLTGKKVFYEDATDVKNCNFSQNGLQAKCELHSVSLCLHLKYIKTVEQRRKHLKCKESEIQYQTTDCKYGNPGLIYLKFGSAFCPHAPFHVQNDY